MLTHPRTHILENVMDAAPWSPGSARKQTRAIPNKNPQISRTIDKNEVDVCFPASKFAANGCELTQRGRVGQTACDVPHPAVPAFECSDLLDYQITEIRDMKKVPDLLAGSAISDIGEGPAEPVR